MKRLLLFVVIVAVALAAGDVWLRRSAEDAAADLIDLQIPQEVEPEVGLDGFPFVLSVLTGRFDEVTVSVPDVTESGLTIEEVRLVLEDVRLEPLEVLGGHADLRARSVSGTGLVPERSLQAVVEEQAPGLSVSIEGDRIMVSGNGTTVAATAVIASNRLLLRAGDLVTIEVPLPEMLPGVSFSSLEATPGELRLEVAGGRMRIKI